MNRQVTILVDHDDLTQEAWGFYLMDHGVVLNSWQRLTRPSKRHKFKTNHLEASTWHRLELRHNRREKPTPPQYVIDKALETIRQSIKMAQ